MGVGVFLAQWYSCKLSSRAPFWKGIQLHDGGAPGGFLFLDRLGFFPSINRFVLAYEEDGSACFALVSSSAKASLDIPSGFFGAFSRLVRSFSFVASVGRMPRMSFTAFAISTCYEMHVGVSRASSVHACLSSILRWNPPRPLLLFVTFRSNEGDREQRRHEVDGGTTKWQRCRQQQALCPVVFRCVELCSRMAVRQETNPIHPRKNSQKGGHVKLTSTHPKGVDSGSEWEGVGKGGIGGLAGCDGGRSDPFRVRRWTRTPAARA